MTAFPFAILILIHYTQVITCREIRCTCDDDESENQNPNGVFSVGVFLVESVTGKGQVSIAGGQR